VSTQPVAKVDDHEPCVLVVGATALDAKGQPTHTLQVRTSVPGTVHLAIGGCGRNIAENLARLGVCTTLISAVGNDRVGHLILEATAESGVDVSHVLVSERHRTAGYIAILDRGGAPLHAIDGMEIMASVTPGLIYRQRKLFRGASMIVVDANLSPKTLDAVVKLARKYRKPVCADPTSALLAPRLKPYLSDIKLMTPNVREAAVLAGLPLDEEMNVHSLALKLVALGVETVIITLAEMGLYYATSDESGRVPALQRDIVDLTGAGDALTAAVIFGLLNQFPVSEAVRLGVSAAALTIQCPETVCPNLSLDRLYDELVI
jgi:pseudouridine kinase